jgi:hypothetical protein
MVPEGDCLMPDASSRGPEVPSHEDLLRGIVRPEWWDPHEEHLSSAIFAFPKVSAFIVSMFQGDPLAKFPVGSGLLKLNTGVARALGFDARHEPEECEQAHANIYCDLNSNQRKKRAKRLIDDNATVVTVKPDLDKLRASQRGT